MNETRSETDSIGILENKPNSPVHVNGGSTVPSTEHLVCSEVEHELTGWKETTSARLDFQPPTQGDCADNIPTYRETVLLLCE